MTDYQAYRAHVGIANPDMTKALKTMFPAFTKVNSALINHPDRHGVCLLPEAEQLLVQIYGEGPGLASVKFSGKPEKKRSDSRRKNNRITFRMNDEDLEKALTLKEYSGAMSMQELFEILLRDAYKRWEVEE